MDTFTLNEDDGTAKLRAQLAEANRQLTFERMQHEECKHNCRRSVAYAKALENELRALRDASR